MSSTVMNMLARRLGCTSMYPDWYIVRQLLRTKLRRFAARQLSRPAAKAFVEPGQVLRGTLAGLPELRLFPDARARREALDNYGNVMCHDRNWRWWTFAALLVVVSTATGYALSALVTYCGMPVLAYGTGNYLLRAGTMTFAFWTLLRKAQRVGAAAHMRLLLIDRGVAVCVRCGYCLAGHDETAERCPECGRVIDELTRRRLGQGSGVLDIESRIREEEQEQDCIAKPQAA